MLICRSFCAEGCYGDCYSWLLLVWLVISPHPSSQEKEIQSTVISARPSLESCRLFSRCTTLTSSSPLACQTSVVILLSCISSVFLGLAGVSNLEDVPGGSVQDPQPGCLSDSWEAVLKLTVSWTLPGLNNCGLGSLRLSHWKKLAALGSLRLTHRPRRA